MESRFALKEFPRLQTDRLILRQGEKKDCQAIFELYSCESVVAYMPLAPFADIQEAIDEMNWHQRIFAEGTGMRWLIEEKESGKVIGTCGFLNFDHTHNRIEIGYDLSPDFWGQGLMKEAADRVISFGFSLMKVNRIEARVEPENGASMRLMDKLGFHKEGVLRQLEFEKGKYVDLAVFSLLLSEYEMRNG
ncbi:IS1595 family transposase ISSpgl1 [Paenibacillus plantiphilus]|uniref:IS1595 family transposase ISSpgl1 n=1 Tax=Paenibacillus plantiphilus TaxID=2905650 RepID=A0ABM9CGL0_9BACL|nr:GNAT family protein [Paenibacillus plantiphilus]CAH1212175.1 IS1595 family transposase ISSpgl1 [Paenibacillus plantiphilus]